MEDLGSAAGTKVKTSDREEPVRGAAPAVDCPACGGGGLAPFYAVEGVPVHSVLLMDTS